MIEDVARLNQAVMQALSAGDLQRGQALLLQLLAQDKDNVPAWLNLAAVQRQIGNTSGASAALRQVLKLDSRNFPALLMHASLLEREGQAIQAAAAYGVALVQAPPDAVLDPATLQAVRHARAVHGRHIDELNSHIRERATEAIDRCTPVERRRVEAFIGTTLRTRKRYQQEPMEYYYPGLPSIEFYERDEFSWLADLESATDPILSELHRIVDEDEPGFRPYINYDDHKPLDQWRELNRSPRWNAYHFYHLGEPVADRCARAPATMQALARVPQARLALRSPCAMFSVLRPQTRIPPHNGVANFRLVAHLPLILPGSCGFRVGGETREWRVGEAWVFDDTIEHEAWNLSDETRVILICDIWSPRLSDDERAAITRVITAADAFSGVLPAAHI